nr:uncharacterized protein LOC133608527 isoform X3 [Nerophis lumbriciformis]
MLDAMEEFAPSSDSDCTAVPPPGQASPGRCRRRPVAVKRAGRREFTPSSDSDCIAVPPPGQPNQGSPNFPLLSHFCMLFPRRSQAC